MVTFTVFARSFLIWNITRIRALIDFELAPNDDAFSNNGGRSILGDRDLIKFYFEVK